MEMTKLCLIMMVKKKAN